jgi:hypothetical protein
VAGVLRLAESPEAGGETEVWRGKIVTEVCAVETPRRSPTSLYGLRSLVWPLPTTTLYRVPVPNPTTYVPAVRSTVQ